MVPSASAPNKLRSAGVAIFRVEVDVDDNDGVGVGDLSRLRFGDEVEVGDDEQRLFFGQVSGELVGLKEA